MGIRITRNIKFLGFFFLLVFTMQVTGLTCFGEDLPLNTSGIQGSSQLIKANLDEGTDANPPADIIDHYQCPCHLTFTETPSTELISYQSTGVPAFFAGDLSLNKVSADILQPPKLLI